ncbi:NYN domain-containing protein [Rhizobium sp. BK176]|uniref:NYN domain-containing protein n=1 Tax=Rhizobium sp. BK176 TaxID=2587071 RepID=UPI00216A3D8B|nr:NYN domain-containing protein [Rhizobium sp. BK176]MCS4088812.1 hypothetical protein [Rhizobium sp. BK176]
MIDVNGSENSGSRPRVAVLIDLENTSHRLAEKIFHEAAQLGEVVVRRGYADFSNKALGWGAAINTQLIDPIHRSASSKGKNSSDIALTIDAMDLLYEGFHGRIDVFCIVTSDGDFGQIVRNIRVKGREAIGMGVAPASAFTQSCSRYVSLVDNKVTASTVTIRAVDEEVVRVFNAALTQTRADDGWATLAEMSNAVIQSLPGFKPKNYGFKKLTDMAENMPGFEVERIDGGVVRIRSLVSPEPEVAVAANALDGAKDVFFGLDSNVVQLVANHVYRH